MKGFALNFAAFLSFILATASFGVAIHVPFFMGFLIIPGIFWGIFFVSLVIFAFAAAKLKDTTPKIAFFVSFGVIFVLGLVFLFASNRFASMHSDRIGGLKMYGLDAVKAIEATAKLNNTTALTDDVITQLAGALPQDGIYMDRKAPFRIKRLSDVKYAIYSTGPDCIDDKLAKQVDNRYLERLENRFNIIGGCGGWMEGIVREMCVWELTTVRSRLKGDVLITENTLGESIKVNWPGGKK